MCFNGPIEQIIHVEHSNCTRIQMSAQYQNACWDIALDPAIIDHSLFSLNPSQHLLKK